MLPLGSSGNDFSTWAPAINAENWLVFLALGFDLDLALTVGIWEVNQCKGAI